MSICDIVQSLAESLGLFLIRHFFVIIPGNFLSLCYIHGREEIIKSVHIVLEESMMNIEAMRQRLKEKAGPGAGMILLHNGVVRGTSRDGSLVNSIEVQADFQQLEKILEEARKMKGILAVEAELRTGTLQVGDDIMILGVAGDIRDNVIHCLAATLDRIKSEVTSKKEFK